MELVGRTLYCAGCSKSVGILGTGEVACPEPSPGMPRHLGGDNPQAKRLEPGRRGRCARLKQENARARRNRTHVPIRRRSGGRPCSRAMIGITCSSILIVRHMSPPSVPSVIRFDRVFLTDSNDTANNQRSRVRQLSSGHPYHRQSSSPRLGPTSSGPRTTPSGS